MQANPVSWQRRLSGRLLSLRLLAVAVFALTGPAADVLAQSTGTIEGRVLNVGTGRYLNNAKVTLEGTARETFTNEFGEYRLADVPAGEAKVRVFYTGLDAETQTVQVTAGAATTANFDLTSRERYGGDKTVVLDAFVVQSNREYEGDALATNEQRHAPNVKVVMPSDAFGAVNEGNPGEFLKFLPGVSVDYVAADVRTVSVRGFASNFSNVYWDGMRLTSSASGSSNRVFEFEQVSINNTSRTEITKLPTPDTPADSLGGSVNFISKNAFERKGAQFNYRAYLNLNSENTKIFSKTPGPKSESSYKVLPNFDFDYTLPVSDRFGIVLTGLYSNQHVEQHRWQPTWNYAQAGATPANPYLQQWQLQDGPKTTQRSSLGLKADWKLDDYQTLSVGLQNNYYATFFGNRNINFNMGTNPAPTPSSGTALQWGPTFTQAATGRGSVTQQSSHRDKLGNTAAANLVWRWDKGDWNVDAGASVAVSKTWYRALARGHFANIATTLQGVTNLRADNAPEPGMTFAARDAAGNVINPYVLSNYRINTATNDPIDGKANMKSARLNVSRYFGQLSVPLTVRFGVDRRVESRDNRRYSESYTHVGPDGVANTADDNAAQYLDNNYIGQNPYFGSPAPQWIDAYALAAAFRSNPAWFTINQVTAEANRINNSERIQETVTAGYVQVEGKLMNNKLRVVAGLRYELTEDEGEGRLFNPDAVWQRTATGAYVDGDPVAPGVQRVRRTDAGAVGSMEELRLTRVERGFVAENDYDSYNPSVHLTYSVTDDFLVRLAYAQTFGRPDYANIIPNTDIDENDADPTTPGSMTIRNTGLKPWTADNFDLSLEYYFKKGGYVSGGAFLKKISDFWETRGGTVDAALAGELGLDPRFIGWGVSTTVNGGSAEISGMEFSAVTPLKFDFLPDFARHFQVRANGTFLHLSGSNTPDFRAFIAKTGNFSISYNRKPVVVNVNWNYRGRQKGTTTTNPALQTGAQYGATTGFFEYYKPRSYVDMSAEYQINKRFTVFVAARNLLNEPQIIERFNADSPGYARTFRQEEFGINFSAGVKGTW